MEQKNGMIQIALCVLAFTQVFDAIQLKTCLELSEWSFGQTYFAC